MNIVSMILAGTIGGYFGWCASTVHGWVGVALATPGFVAIGAGVPTLVEWAKERLER